eukprot:6174870-Pleurochrysis_carterae.AAC.2
MELIPALPSLFTSYRAGTSPRRALPSATMRRMVAGPKKTNLASTHLRSTEAKDCRRRVACTRFLMTLLQAAIRLGLHYFQLKTALSGRFLTRAANPKRRQHLDLLLILSSRARCNCSALLLMLIPSASSFTSTIKPPDMPPLLRAVTGHASLRFCIHLVLPLSRIGRAFCVSGSRAKMASLMRFAHGEATTAAAAAAAAVLAAAASNATTANTATTGAAVAKTAAQSTASRVAATAMAAETFPTTSTAVTSTPTMPMKAKTRVTASENPTRSLQKIVWTVSVLAATRR